MRIRFLTYNIHKAIGNDRVYNPDRIAAVLKSMDPDVIALQEVDSGAERSMRHHQAEILAEALGMNYAFALNVKLKSGGGYGNALLTKFSIESWQNIDLTWTIKKVRSCLAGVIDTGSGEILVMNYHLGLAGIERIIQARKLMKSPYYNDFSGLPAVLLGDTNDRSHKLDSVLSHHGFKDSCESEKIFTFPSYSPMLRLDKIHYTEPFRLNALHVVRSSLTSAASDHLPVLADFTLP